MQNTKHGSFLDIDFLIEKTGISAGQRVADLGCGSSGHFTFPLAEKVGEKGLVYAVDVVKTSLNVVEKRKKSENIENIKTVWSDLEIFKATDIDNESLDTALLLNTIYQAKKTSELLREAYRIVKKHGKLLIVDWKNIQTPLGPPYNQRANKEKIKTEARKIGFELMEEFNAGEYHFGLLFNKI